MADPKFSGAYLSGDNQTVTVLDGDVVSVGSPLTPPVTTKTYGLNIRPWDQTNWFTLFQYWSQFWDVWTRPQLERVKLVGNCVRLIGDVSGQARGLYTQSQYFAAWNQLCQWCSDNGIKLYPCLMGVESDSAASWQQILDNASALAAHLVTNWKSILYGIDLCNEAHAAAPPRPFTPLMYAQLYDAVRVEINDQAFPLTFSEATTAFGQAGQWTLNANTAALVSQGLLDFFDFHVYGTDPVSNALDVIHSAYPNMRIVFGEFGIENSATSAIKVNRINTVMALAAQPFVDGCLAWAAQDISWIGESNNPDDMGYYDALGYPREDMTTAFILGEVTGGGGTDTTVQIKWTDGTTTVQIDWSGNMGTAVLTVNGVAEPSVTAAAFNQAVADQLIGGRTWPPTTTGVVIVDDDDAGFSVNDSVAWKRWGNQGYHNSVRECFKGDGSAVATWTFPVQPGSYKVAVTWYPYSNRATNSPFSVWDGANVLATVPTNQQVAPSDFQDSGVGWKNLGTFTIVGNTLVVKLTNNANGNLNADAVRIEKV